MMAMARGLAVGWLAASLAGCALEPTPPPRAPDSSEALLGRLPETLGGFRRGGTTPVTEPFPATEVAYATTSRAIAGYVQVATASGDNDTEAELRRFVAEAVTGAARRMRERGAAAIAGFRCIELEGTFGRQPVESLACAGAFGGRLVRLRLTMTRRGDRMGEAREFTQAVAAALRG